MRGETTPSIIRVEYVAFDHVERHFVGLVEHVGCDGIVIARAFMLRRPSSRGVRCAGRLRMLIAALSLRPFRQASRGGSQ